MTTTQTMKRAAEHTVTARAHERNAIRMLSPKAPNTPPEGSTNSRRKAGVRYAKAADQAWIKAIASLLS